MMILMASVAILIAMCNAYISSFFFTQDTACLVGTYGLVTYTHVVKVFIPPVLLIY